jgi:hypothetical protein
MALSFRIAIGNAGCRSCEYSEWGSVGGEFLFGESEHVGACFEG